MNTKQIWQAINNNPKIYNYFDGVYSLDTLCEIRKKPKLIICNTDPSYLPGKHWVLFYFRTNKVEFFDSTASSIHSYGDEFVKFIFKFAEKCESNSVAIQKKGTDVCGEYCLYYAYLKCNGYTMSQIIKKLLQINSKRIKNIVNRIFIYCKHSTCHFVQNATK